MDLDERWSGRGRGIGIQERQYDPGLVATGRSQMVHRGVGRQQYLVEVVICLDCQLCMSKS